MAFPAQSIDFEASSSQSASIADASQTGLDITGALTLETWIRLESAPGTDGAMSIMGKWVDAGSQDSYLLQYIDQGGTKRFRFLNSDNGSDVGLATVDHTLVTDTWVHVAGVYTTAPLFELFINGVSQGSSAGSLKTSIFASSATFIVSSDNGSGYVDGRMVLSRVWSTNRSQAQIDGAKCTTLGATTNLAAEWTFDNTYNDNSGNSNTLTGNNSPTFGANVPAVCTVVAGGRDARKLLLMGVG